MGCRRAGAAGRRSGVGPPARAGGLLGLVLRLPHGRPCRAAGAWAGERRPRSRTYLYFLVALVLLELLLGYVLVSRVHLGCP